MTDCDLSSVKSQALLCKIWQKSLVNETMERVVIQYHAFKKSCPDLCPASDSFRSVCIQEKWNTATWLIVTFPEFCKKHVKELVKSTDTFYQLCEIDGCDKLVKWFEDKRLIDYTRAINCAYDGVATDTLKELFKSVLTYQFEATETQMLKMIDMVIEDISIYHIEYVRWLMSAVPPQFRLHICKVLTEGWASYDCYYDDDYMPIRGLSNWLSIFTVDEFWHPEVQCILEYVDIFTDYMTVQLPEKRAEFMRVIAPHLPPPVN